MTFEKNNNFQKSSKITTNNRNTNDGNKISSATKSNLNRAFKTNKTQKTNAQALQKPHFVFKRHIVDREVGPNQLKNQIAKIINQLKSGNLANSYLSPVSEQGIRIATNSPVKFADGEIIKIIPIGGTNEVGMNMTAIESGNNILLIDTGMGFGGGEKFPGVDYIIPDTSYLEQNRHKIRGLIYTHGHLDHIGGAPYILPKLGNIPIFGMPLTLALLRNRLQEFELDNKILAKVIEPRKSLKLGRFEVEFFRLNHSISDVVGLSINTHLGRIVYCTDWKFDNTPFDGKLSDYAKLAELGDQGVRLLLTDSLGILKPGYSISERDIGKTVDKIFEQATGRIIFTTFSTTIARLQHVVNSSSKYGRKLAITGKSMIANFNAAFELGYIKVPSGLIVDFKEINKYPDDKIAILSTGSQGEDNAVLSRLARDEHPNMKLQGGDSVIFSNSQIPGNEQAIQDLIAKLSRKGIDVFHPKEFDLHVSGHACHEDLKMLIALTRPDYLQPIHGDHYMLKSVAKLGMSMGIPLEHNLIGENGRIIELRPSEVVLTDNIITENYLLVEGTSVGTVSEIVLQERRQMATQGTIIIIFLINKKKELLSGPEIVSRGFVYVKTTTELIDLLKSRLREEFNNLKLDPRAPTYFSELRENLKRLSSEVIYQATEKTPMIIPVVIQV